MVLNRGLAVVNSGLKEVNGCLTKGNECLKEIAEGKHCFLQGDEDVLTRRWMDEGLTECGFDSNGRGSY